MSLSVSLSLAGVELESKFEDLNPHLCYGVTNTAQTAIAIGTV